MIHGGERSSHGIAINDGYIEVNASGKGTQTISAPTRFVSKFISVLQLEIRLKLK